MKTGTAKVREVVGGQVYSQGVAVVRVFTRCPECGSDEICELGRVEAATFGNEEDLAVYHCDACGAEWDTTLEPQAR